MLKQLNAGIRWAASSSRSSLRAVAFLASDAASAITGVVLPVDCGLMAGNIVMARELTLEDFLSGQPEDSAKSAQV